MSWGPQGHHRGHPGVSGTIKGPWGHLRRHLKRLWDVLGAVRTSEGALEHFKGHEGILGSMVGAMRASQEAS